MSVEAKAGQARIGLRQRLLPEFLRDKPSITPKDILQDGEWREIPETAFSPEGVARLSAMTYGIGDNWETSVVLYEPDRDATVEPTRIGRRVFQAHSAEEAKKLEEAFMREHVSLVGGPQDNLPPEAASIANRYSQQVYQVLKSSSS